MLHISPKWFALTSVIAGLVFAASARAQVVPRVPQAESKAPAPSAKLSGNRSAAQGSYLAVPGY